ncbi:exported protein of unknown function [Nitrospira defluvii]|uniref:Uncharacterized protein n=1 Tax=Nitrospira defluvii TaxID=330214 RepID=D8PEL0_9BACT|nr:exported protein of unknown function [Nitrospira defluvii]
MTRHRRQGSQSTSSFAAIRLGLPAFEQASRPESSLPAVDPERLRGSAVASLVGCSGLRRPVDCGEYVHFTNVMPV